jgi:ketosteroid isomerase-like protein
MTAPTPLALERAESALQEALRTSDITALEQLLHPDVIFVDSDGQELDKAADLATHTSGALRLTEVVELHRATNQFGTAGVTRVRLRLRGTSGGVPFVTDAFYTRTWIHAANRWQVVQAHGVTIPPRVEP